MIFFRISFIPFVENVISSRYDVIILTFSTNKLFKPLLYKDNGFYKINFCNLVLRQLLSIHPSYGLNNITAVLLQWLLWYWITLKDWYAIKHRHVTKRKPAQSYMTVEYTNYISAKLLHECVSSDNIFCLFFFKIKIGVNINLIADRWDISRDRNR